jgi:tRNA-modifying protein YgfZ
VQEITASQAYEATRSDVAFARLTEAGWIRVTGPDRQDFVHRLTTNQVLSLKPGQGQVTVLASPTGRVMALLFAYAAHDALYLRTEAGQAPSVARFLQRMIFWNDDVSVQDASAEVAMVGLFGPQARLLAARVSGSAAFPEAPYAWSVGVDPATVAIIARGGPLDLPDAVMIAPRDSAGSLLDGLVASLPGLSPDDLAALRVERGIPAWGHELSDAYTPLEGGLAGAVSFDKGCYTGQEVIARQANYDRIPRQLSTLLFSPEAPDWRDWRNASIPAGGGRPGLVTTISWLPRLSRPVALAIIPRSAATPGAEVRVVRADGAESRAIVGAMPLVGGTSAIPSEQPS